MVRRRYNKAVGWVLRQKTAIAIALGLVVIVVAAIWFWGVLVGYVKPEGSTGRKDVVQAFALIVAGVVGLIGGIVGIANLSVSRRNLQQQIELEQHRRESALQIEELRSHDTALQGYFEQIGILLTDHNLIGTDRDDIRQLAVAQTLTVLARLNGGRKALLIRFLHGAGLITKDNPIVVLTLANLRGALLAHTFLGEAALSYVDLSNANLESAYLSEADLSQANLTGANLMRTNLTAADLSQANLTGANLLMANLAGADLSQANLTGANVVGDLDECKSLKGATMPNGMKYERWLGIKPGPKK